MLLAAREIVLNGLDLAAEELETSKADLEFAGGEYRIKGTDRRIAITALALKHPGKLDLDFKERPKVGSTFPNGCHIAEVEVDPETGEVERSYWLRRGATSSTTRRRRQMQGASAGPAHLRRAGGLRRERRCSGQLHGYPMRARGGGGIARDDTRCDEDQHARGEGGARRV